MKRNIHYITLLTASLGLLAGCASNRQATKIITATPSPCVLTPDSANRVRIEMIFNVPENYFSRRSRLVITPQLVINDTVKDEYMPLVLDAPIYNKKINRKKVLDNYIDPLEDRAVKADKASRSFSLPYEKTVQLPQGAEEGRIVAVVSSDGCGECTGIDTIDIAAISNPITLMVEDVKGALQLSWIEPEFVIRPKIMEGKGVANLQFGINKSDINLSMGNNRKELDDMMHTLSPILKDTLATLNSIAITGMASADGSLALNTTLARNRAASAKQWLVGQLNIQSNTQRLISVDSRPEGWEPVLAAMVADSSPDTVAVKNILETYKNDNDDVQERYIRRLPCWSRMKNNYLQKDRKVEYVYTYTLKSFTSDAELLDMYRKRPDAFNEEELLRVATLADSHDKKKEVYQTIQKYFPGSQVAANNLAVLYLHEGKEAKAREVLSALTEYSPEMLNTLAASYVYTNEYEKAIELLQSVKLPEARYNLGLLQAKKRRFYEAYELLRPFADVNSAIVALSINKNEDAKTILVPLKDNTPVAEYARSITAARLQEDEQFYLHIGNACEDTKLHKRAATEPDFYRYHAEDRFQTLINKK